MHPATPPPATAPRLAGGPLLPSRSAAYLIGTLLLIVAGVYLVQVASPLRLNGDGMEYLSLAASALDGEGFIDRGAPSHFPPGYPTLIGLAYLTGLSFPPLLVALNLGFLAVAMRLTFSLGREAFGTSVAQAFGAVLLVLTSFVVVKHATLPLAETAYLGVSLAALYAIFRVGSTRGAHQLVWVAASLVLIAGAMMFRTIGVALVPALVFVLGRAAWERWVAARTRRQKALVLGGLAVGLGAPFVYAVVRSIYFQQFVRRVFGYGDAGGVLSRNVRWKLIEWGQLTLNIPYARLPDSLGWLLPLAGLAGLALVGYGVWRQRRRFGAPEAYLLTYAAILLVWPGFDARFWLPVLPLLVLFALAGATALVQSRAGRVLAGAYLLGYLLAGAGALGYSTRVSLSGPAFAERFGDGSLRATYRLVYTGEAGRGELSSRALRLLLRYEPAAHPNARGAYEALRASSESSPPAEP